MIVAEARTIGSPRAFPLPSNPDRVVFLALKEMRRAKVRFGLLISAIGLLVLLILAQQAIQSGLITSFIGAIERQSAPVLVFSVDGQKTLQGSIITPPLEKSIRSTEGIAEAGRIGQGTFTVKVNDEVEDSDAAIIGYTDPDLGAPGQRFGRSHAERTRRGGRQQCQLRDR